MKVLVLGGSGHIGARLCSLLAESGWAAPVSGSRRAAPGMASVRVDVTDAASVRAALAGMDAVVNCVAGSADAIAGGARVLAEAVRQSGCPRLVHLSSMAVYGALEGEVAESAPRDPSIGWYAKAKCEAEDVVGALASRDTTVAMLRPGCVGGPGSELWVGRIGRLLRAGRLGDLGAAGDGWSNLVDVDDVCAAIQACLRLPAGGVPRVYNLAAPDSPRWNDYFVDLALALGATPVPRLSARRLRIDARLAGPPLKVLEIVARRVGLAARSLPDPLPPGLLGVFERHLHLRAERAQQELGLRWTPYEQVLQRSAAWFVAAHAVPVRAAGRLSPRA